MANAPLPGPTKRRRRPPYHPLSAWNKIGNVPGPGLGRSGGQGRGRAGGVGRGGGGGVEGGDLWRVVAGRLVFSRYASHGHGRIRYHGAPRSNVGNQDAALGHGDCLSHLPLSLSPHPTPSVAHEHSYHDSHQASTAPPHPDLHPNAQNSCIQIVRPSEFFPLQEGTILYQTPPAPLQMIYNITHRPALSHSTQRNS